MLVLIFQNTSIVIFFVSTKNELLIYRKSMVAYFMSTRLIFMSTCQIIMSTYQIITSTCQIKSSQLVDQYQHVNALNAIYLSVEYLTNRHNFLTSQHNDPTYRHNYLKLFFETIMSTCHDRCFFSTCRLA